MAPSKRRALRSRLIVLVPVVPVAASALIASIFTLQALATSRALDTAELRPFHEGAQRALRTHRSWTTINLLDEHGQQLIEANGGRVTVQSEPGHGTRIVPAFDPLVPGG